MRLTLNAFPYSSVIPYSSDFSGIGKKISHFFASGVMRNPYQIKILFSILVVF